MPGRYTDQNFSQGIATKQKKLQNPDDTSEVVQIGYADTGLVTALGEKIFAAMTIGPGGVVPPSLPSSLPANPLISITATAAAMPSQALVNGVVLRAPAGNVASVWIGGDNTVTVNNGYELEPGESVPVTVDNMDDIWIIGNALDKLQWLGG